jgi:hypothetical protein
MDKKLSDEQIDRIAKDLLENFALSSEALDEIAAAPQLWRNVRNRIEAENARRENSRFRWFRAPVLAFGALIVLVCGVSAFMFFSPANRSNPTAALDVPVENQSPSIAGSADNTPEALPEVDFETPENPKRQLPAKAPLKTAARQNELVAKSKTRENSAKPPSRSSNKEIPAEAAVEETKTDFIALSYAANTESGQIVRVKVPSSMMVTLGVKAEVGDGAELVNAEVVIGDDGLARAIRFIR